MYKVLTIATITILLSACSDGPSQKEIRNALEIETKEKMAMMPDHMRNTFEILAIELDKCEKLESDKYSCTYDATIKGQNPFTKETAVGTDTMTTKFFEGDDGWRSI